MGIGLSFQSGWSLYHCRNGSGRRGRSSLFQMMVFSHLVYLPPDQASSGGRGIELGPSALDVFAKNVARGRATFASC